MNNSLPSYEGDHEFDKEEVRRLLKEEDGDESFHFSLQLANTFLESYRSDDEWYWPALIKMYLENPEYRDVIDNVFVHLCGWSFAKLIEDTVELNKD
jgi:hypothetical protein